MTLSSRTVISDDEQIGRALYSKSEFSVKFMRAKAGAFKPERGKFKRSMSLLDRENNQSLSDQRARNARPFSTFYGWGVLFKPVITMHNCSVRPDPTSDNPYHANIKFPSDEDQHILTARKLADHSCFKPPVDQ